VVWLIGVATTTSERAVELVPLQVTGVRCTNMLHQLKNSKKMNKNEETESLMIENVPELIEAARREVVVVELATATTEFLAAALGVEDVGGRASGGRSEGRRTGAGWGVGVRGTAAGAAETGAQEPGWRPGGDGRAGGGRGVAGGQEVCAGRGRGVGVSVRRVVGA
jgi:hypothetical protein